MFRRSVILAVVLVLTGAAFQPCYAYKKVNAVVPVAPRYVLQGVKQIAVLDFGGERDSGRKLADLMVERLVKEDRVASAYAAAPGKIFKIIERSRLQQVLQEQNLGESGVIDDAQAAQIGKVLGIDVIVTGNVAHQVAESQEWEEHTYYVKKQTLKRNVLCTTRQVQLDCSMRIVDVNSGEIRVSETMRPMASDKWCQDEEGGLLTEASLVNQVLDGLAPSLVMLFEPYGQGVEIDLHKVKTSDKGDSKLAETAAEKAEAGNLNGAYGIYNALYQKDNFNVQLIYNLGVLHEVTGDLSKARELYETGAMLKDEDKFRDGLARVASAEQAWNYYGTMGVGLSAAPFDTLAAGAEAEQVQLQTGVINGGEKDRVNVYTASDMATVQTALPGKVKVSVLETGAGWVKVKLPGDKQGYVASTDIKIK